MDTVYVHITISKSSSFDSQKSSGLDDKLYGGLVLGGKLGWVSPKRAPGLSPHQAALLSFPVSWAGLGLPRYVQCPESHSPPPPTLASQACSSRPAVAGRLRHSHRDAHAAIPWKPVRNL